MFNKEKALVFSTDDQFVQQGLGDVDQINIMKAGNIKHFPKETTVSKSNLCSANFEIDGSSSVKLSGKILADDGP